MSGTAVPAGNCVAHGYHGRTCCPRCSTSALPPPPLAQAPTAVNRRAKLGSVPSAPHSPSPPDGQNRGTDPYMAIRDPELRLAVMHAHHAWAERYCPWLLERWLH